jgi:hypothetical protein
MEDSISKLPPKPSVKFVRETKKETLETHGMKSKILDLGTEMKPMGTVCVGFACVFYFENESELNPGGSYASLTAVGNLNEFFVDKGIAELARHSMQLFNRKPPKDPK